MWKVPKLPIPSSMVEDSKDALGKLLSFVPKMSLILITSGATEK